MSISVGRSPLIIGLTVATVGMVVLVNSQLGTRPTFDVAVLPPAAGNQARTEINPPVSVSRFPPRNEFAVIIARPLFSKDRRPVTPNALPKQKPREKPAKARSSVPASVFKRAPVQRQREPEVARFDAKLVGVAMTQNQGIALLQEENSSKLIRLVVGDTYKGWSVAMVERSSITFTSGGDKMKFDVLFREKE